MRVRLLTCTPVWVRLLLILLVSNVNESKATLDLAECASNDYLQFTPKISLLDVWAGVSSFGQGFDLQSYVTVEDFSWIEKAAVAITVLTELHGAVRGCSDFYCYSWRAWKFAHDLVICAGPSCCPFSVSGKRLRQEDPRASQGMDTAVLAVTLGALVLVMENVVNFVEEDYLHSLLSDINQYLLDNELVEVGVWTLCDAALGGGLQLGSESLQDGNPLIWHRAFLLWKMSLKQYRLPRLRISWTQLME
jgi:hypothetical protein